jgi:choice-of-anchor B domain-containing protein
MRRYILIITLFAAQILSAQTYLDFLSQVQFPVRSSSLTRYADEEGNEYALIGIYDATVIVDITDPASPETLFSVPGPAGIWREMKTYNHHAYITNETDSGLQIIDLTDLPASVESKFLHFAGEDTLKKKHTIFIDEQGYAYLFGGNTDNGGATILDLNIDPMTPPKVGGYDHDYIHDGFVRGDTLWASFIYTGQFAVIDMSDKTNPVLLALQSTPSAFTHNCWLSDDGKYLFTTDEKADAYVTSYDVSDLTDIKELGRFQSHPGTDVIPHNVYWLNNYLVIAYYRDGVILVDATKPDNMVEVGYYDTSAFPSAGIFNGCWGVDPYLPSGNIIASDIEEGLFMLQPTYHRATYLEGTVFDELNGVNTVNAKVEIMSTDDFDLSDFTGTYKTGTSEAGVYDIRISKEGCYTEIIPDIELITGETYTLDATIACTLLVDATDIEQKLEIEVFPNVFQTSSVIQYVLPAEVQHAEIFVYTASGKQVEVIALKNKTGYIPFGNELASGFYFLKLIADDTAIKTFQVVKGG